MTRNIIVVLVAVWLTACQPSPPSVGTVNGRAITQAEFERYLAFRRIETADEKRRAAILQDYLRREALAGVIEQQGAVDSDMIAVEFNEFRKEQLINRYFDDFLRETVSDDVVLDYYTTHTADYQQRKARVSHIVVRTDRAMRGPERLARKTKIQEAYSRIMAGEAFAEVAAAYSEDAIHAMNGGDLGWLAEGAIDPLFSDKIFSVEPNRPTEPFENPSGFHIVMVTDGPETVNRTFEEVKSGIRNRLRDDAREAELARLLDQARVESGS